MRTDVLKFSLRNIKKNGYILISATAFFCLECVPTVPYFFGMLLALGLVATGLSRYEDLWQGILCERVPWKVFYMLTAAGICWAGQVYSYEVWDTSSRIQALEASLPVNINIPACVSITGSIVSYLFVFCCVTIFWKSLKKLLIETYVFQGIVLGEIVFYALLFVITVTFMTVVFTKTDAFYGTEFDFDIIYTSDSPSHVKRNVYSVLTHPENDIRQPLFAVFSAPFVGIVYLFGKIIGVQLPVQAVLTNVVQIALLFFANFILVKSMDIPSINRCSFMLVLSFTYTHLLFILMMEQYIVAYFWIVVCVYAYCKKGRVHRFAFWGASGTLLTSIVLIPLVSEKHPVKQFKNWCIEMVLNGLIFFAVVLGCSRFDVFYNLKEKLSMLKSYSGQNLTITDKTFQYTEFVRNCFFAPNAEVNFTAVDHVSWQLLPANGFNLTGIVLLLLVVVSAIVNRRKRVTLQAACWVVFSTVILLILGWGTEENGLILYALYFNWAFFVLLFLLVNAIAEKIHFNWLVPVLSVICALVLAVINIPGITKMICFAINYFPI